MLFLTVLSTLAGHRLIFAFPLWLQRYPHPVENLSLGRWTALHWTGVWTTKRRLLCFWTRGKSRQSYNLIAHFSFSFETWEFYSQRCSVPPTSKRSIFGFLFPFFLSFVFVLFFALKDNNKGGGFLNPLSFLSPWLSTLISWVGTCTYDERHIKPRGFPFIQDDSKGCIKPCNGCRRRREENGGGEKTKARDSKPRVESVGGCER